MAYAFNDDKSKCNLMFNKIVEYQELIKGHTSGVFLFVSKNDLRDLIGTDDYGKIRILAVYLVYNNYKYYTTPMDKDLHVIREVILDPYQKTFPISIAFNAECLENYIGVNDKISLIIGVMD